ncbi:hypothetical protein RB597_001211 [Gaeumannomyces tritici]
MSSWMNDASAASAVPNHNGNGFGAHLNDPSQTTGVMIDPSAYMANAAQFNPAAAQFANPQQMLALQNGAMRNSSPSFPNPVYQTNSVIPSKRPRPRDESIAGSPRPAPGMAQTSRSETPQQAHYSNYPQQQQTPGPGQPSPYPHLQQNGSANATPSPIMSNQMRPGSVPQRVSTTSPHPYSPAAQNFGSQASPAPSEHGGTPQPNNFMPPGTFPQGFNQHYAASPTPVRPSPSHMGGQMPGQLPGQMAPQQMGQMGQQMGQMPPHMAQQMAQMGQMPPQMGQMFPGQMQQMNPGQMSHMQHMQQQQMSQARNVMDPQRLMYHQMQLQRQLQQQQHQQQQHQQPQPQLQQPPQQPKAQQQQQPNSQPQQSPTRPSPVPPSPVQQSPIQPSPMPPQTPQGQPQAMQAPPQMHVQAMHQNRAMMGRPQMPNGQMAPSPMRPQPGQVMTPQQQQAMQRGGQPTPEQFMERLSQFMSSKGFPLDPNPIVGDRPVSLWNLRQAVAKHGGFRAAHQNNYWGSISNSLGFHPAQMPMAPNQLRVIYERNLMKFEDAWSTSRAKQMQQQQQQQQQAQQHQGQQAGMQVATPGTPTRPGMSHGQMPPGHMMQQPGQHPAMTHAQVMTPMKQMPQPGVNGFVQPQPQPNAMQGHSRNSLSRSIQGTPTHDDFAHPSPSAVKTPRTSTSGPLPHDPSVKLEHQLMTAPPPPEKDPDTYFPLKRHYQDHGHVTHGGVPVGAWDDLASKLLETIPDVPPVEVLGNIDILALCRSLQSGIRAEVRNALDSLAMVTAAESSGPHLQIDLGRTDELVECLLECAEDQIEVLVENTAEVSDEVLITPYQDVVRACWLENTGVHEVHPVGSPEYEVERAVDHLICITTILRNLSFGEANWEVLADESVVKFFCVIIRYLGTRNMLLRTQANTLDFMKDALIILSNISTHIEVPGKEQALCFLQFLLAFAPAPAPCLTGDQLVFPPYQPKVQPYLPAAVDALAKLLVSKEQNRDHFASLYASEASQAPAYDLLTRSFGLAVSVIPDFNMESRSPLSDARRPVLMQGLLAAQTLAALAPGQDSGVTRSWLSCGNGLSQNLIHLVKRLGRQFETAQMVVPPPQRNQRSGRGAVAPQPQPRHTEKTMELVYMVVLAISLLRRLTEKSRDPSDPMGSIPPNALPSRSTLLELLAMRHPEWTSHGMLQQLVAYAALEDC